jgi:adenosylhomocysteine nucleosidase
MKVGIVGAMLQEIALLQKDLQNIRRQTRGMREYLEGELYGKETVLVFSRCGKVAAASTVTTLIEVFDVDFVVFTGVAGAADPALEIGDVVIGTTLVQHDLDPRPLFRRFEVPLLDKITFETPPYIVALARDSASLYLHKLIHQDIAAETLSAFGINSPPRLHEGLIVSGDQFIANPATLAGLRTALIDAGLPAPLCVEMEGAAVAQVCDEHAVPLIVMRTISDKADHSAAIDFVPFIDKVASHFTRGIVEGLIRRV